MLSGHLSRLQQHRKNKQQSLQSDRVATEISLKRSKVKILQKKNRQNLSVLVQIVLTNSEKWSYLIVV